MIHPMQKTHIGAVSADTSALLSRSKSSLSLKASLDQSSETPDWPLMHVHVAS